MKPTDDQLIQQLRNELDQLVADVPVTPAAPPPAAVAGTVREHDRRKFAFGIAAVSIALLVGGLIVVANRGADERTSDTSPPTAPATSSPPTSSPVTIPSETAAPSTAAQATPPTTIDPATPAIEQYEVITPVLETPRAGIQLCLGEWMIAATPPTCVGPHVVGWSWDSFGGGQSSGGATWAEAYVAGAWDPATQVFSVSEARVPTNTDLARFHADTPQPDFTVPCPEPSGGWPARNQEWPAEQVHMIPGYAGSWEDAAHQVVTVKFTGDLAAAEQAVRQYYGDALCVVPAEHSEEELVAISNQLLGMSSVQFLWSQVYADATGEWVEAGVITPDPDRQAAFDAEYGAGVVRLTPRLRPL